MLTKGFKKKSVKGQGSQRAQRVHHWPRDTPESFLPFQKASCLFQKASCLSRKLPAFPESFLPFQKEQSFIIAHNRLRIIKMDQSLIIKGPRVPKGPKGVQDTKINKGQGSQKGPKGPRYQYSFILY